MLKTIAKSAAALILWFLFLVLEIAAFKLAHGGCFMTVGFCRPMLESPCVEYGYAVLILFLLFPIALYFLNKRIGARKITS